MGCNIEECSGGRPPRTRKIYLDFKYKSFYMGLHWHVVSPIPADSAGNSRSPTIYNSRPKWKERELKVCLPISLVSWSPQLFYASFSSEPGLYLNLLDGCHFLPGLGPTRWSDTFSQFPHVSRKLYFMRWGKNMVSCLLNFSTAFLR